MIRERLSLERCRRAQVDFPTPDQSILVRIRERIGNLEIGAGRIARLDPLRRPAKPEDDGRNAFPETTHAAPRAPRAGVDVEIHVAPVDHRGGSGDFDTFVGDRSQVAEDRRAAAAGRRQRHVDERIVRYLVVKGQRQVRVGRFNSASNPNSSSLVRSGLSAELPNPPMVTPGTSTLATATGVATKNCCASVGPGCSPELPYAARSFSALNQSAVGKNGSSERTHDADSRGYRMFPKRFPNEVLSSLRKAAVTKTRFL